MKVLFGEVLLNHVLKNLRMRKPYLREPFECNCMHLGRGRPARTVFGGGVEYLGITPKSFLRCFPGGRLHYVVVREGGTYTTKVSREQAAALVEEAISRARLTAHR